LSISTLKAIEAEFGDFEIKQVWGGDYNVFFRFGYWRSVDLAKLQAIIGGSNEVVEDADYDDEIVEMTTAARQTRSATIARAPRDMSTALGEVRAGDVLALVDGEAIVTGSDLIKVSIECIDRMLNVPSSVGELITLVMGENASNELAEEVQKHLAKNHSNVEVTTYIGGQAWYPLLIGLE
jgi:dihydroxyacetone kinase-like predicted kinase